ncbi:Uma2 family endonuclease [Methylocapsa acidiphila]|uniref:Uma2 family endonuclease n=1 Tax=Methylocapsa acidiphila TaxID=133552 RepID=UPI000405FCB5|nr:Uma2 family endonuclease [Methylocapsa acidiphila]
MSASATQFADGFPRRAFTAEEVLRMQEAGVLDEDERFELIEGEIVLMQAKNYPHERIKLALIRALSRALPDALQLGVETSLYLSKATILEPDLSIFPMMDTTKARGPDVLLVIEVADTTLVKDMRLKAAIYAKYGVRELWVIDAVRLETHVHRDPVDGTWADTGILRAEDLLSHSSAPGFAMRLSEL